MIEKNIFQCYWNRNQSPQAKQWVNETINLYKESNPEYTYHLYNLDDMYNFVKKSFPGRIFKCYNSLNIDVARSDFWRYLVLYKYGGVYVDMDSYLVKPLASYINIDDTAIISPEPHKNRYTMWALIFSSKHKILENLIGMICDNIEQRKFPQNVHKTTGPSVFSLAVNKTHRQLFNEDLNWDQFNKTKRDTHAIFNKNNISYRIYGLSYNDKITFKHKNADILFDPAHHCHWTEEQKAVPVIKK